MIGVFRSLVVASLLLTVSENIPVINTEEQCRIVSEMKIPGRGVAQCLKNEHDAEAALRKLWPEVTRAEKTQCVPYSAGKVAPSYVSLLICIEMLKERRGQGMSPNQLVKP